MVEEIKDYAGDEPEEIRACPSCGGEMERIDCEACGGEGGFDGYELTELDPLWYSLDDWEACSDCNGKGYYWHCWNKHD